MVRDVTPMKMIPRGGNMVTLRVLLIQTSAVGPSASAKHATVVAGTDKHTLHFKYTRRACLNASNERERESLNESMHE